MTQYLSNNNVNPQVLGAAVCPEIELLLCCCRNHIDTLTAEKINNLLQEDINWSYLVQVAFQNGVMPLLYQNLKKTNPEVVPKNILDQLQNLFQSNSLRNVLLARELVQLLQLFETHAIPAIPFKGPVLTICAYGNLALRQFADLDIIVRQRDILKVKDLLIEQGYQLSKKTRKLTQARLKGNLKSQYFYEYFFLKWHNSNNRLRFDVEIHWETTPNHIMFPLNPEQLWQNLEPISLCGTKVLSIPPETWLPLLCINHAKDHWRTLKTICDIAELLRMYQKIDWQQVIEQVRDLRRERTLFLGLFLAHDLLGTILPETVWKTMQTDPIAQSLAMQVRERLLYNSASQLSVGERFLYNLRLREHLQDKIRYSVIRTIKLLKEHG